MAYVSTGDTLKIELCCHIDITLTFILELFYPKKVIINLSTTESLISSLIALAASEGFCENCSCDCQNCYRNNVVKI